MKAPRARAEPTERPKSSRSRAKKMTAATMPRTIALRQVGGASPRTGLRFCLLAAARAGAALAVDPAALRPLVLLAALLLGLGHDPNLVGSGGRLPPGPLDAALDRVQVGIEAADRHVWRVAGQGGGGRQADQLGLDGPRIKRCGQLADPLDHL